MGAKKEEVKKATKNTKKEEVKVPTKKKEVEKKVEVSEEMAQLIEAIDVLNETGLLEENLDYDEEANIEDITEMFMTAVESVPIDKEDELPAEIVDFYNTLVDAVEKKEKEEKKGKSKGKEKPEKQKPEKKDKTEKKEKDPDKVARGKALAASRAGQQGPGVISTILEILTANKGKEISSEKILQGLVKKFPDRNVDAMKKTINVQLPGRMSKEKKVNISKGTKGGYILA